MDIEKAKQDLKYIIDPFRIDGTTLKYSNAVRFILSQLEKKDNIIDLMAEQIFYWQDDKFPLGYSIKDIKQYFTNKAENVGE